VARLIAGLWRKSIDIAAHVPDSRFELGEVNAEPALMAYRGGRLDSVFVFSVDGDQVVAIHGLRNPDKLAWMERQAGPTGR
jgi:RNA polymerase sigma-70 factor (ECF subfamily)